MDDWKIRLGLACDWQFIRLLLKPELTRAEWVSKLLANEQWVCYFVFRCIYLVIIDL